MFCVDLPNFSTIINSNISSWNNLCSSWSMRLDLPINWS